MRYLVASILFWVSSLSTAQGQIGFGPEVGIGISTMHFAPAVGFTSASTSGIFSGKIGGIIDIGLNRKAYFQSGLFLSRKGQARDFSYYFADTLHEAVHQTLYINYIDVPVNIIYKTGTQGKGRVIFGLGVTGSYILGGRNKLHLAGNNGTPFDISTDRKITSDKPVDLFDIGINLSGGYELPTGLFFRAYYTAGVKDIGLGSEIDKNRMWGVSAGCLFGKGRNINKEANDLIDKSK